MFIFFFSCSQSVSVQFSKYACVNYQPQPHHDPPHRSYAPGFKKDDYIHIKEVLRPTLSETPSGKDCNTIQADKGFKPSRTRASLSRNNTILS